MRFKLTLQIQPEAMGRELPINYQYPLQGVIYHTLEKSDLQFSTWLHENGYQMNGKRFKLFTFSNLIVPQYGIDKQRERLIVKSDFVTLYITFLPEKSTQQFIQGLFQQQTFQVSDYISGVQFMVREIQVMPSLDYYPNMVFRTLSPSASPSATNGVTWTTFPPPTRVMNWASSQVCSTATTPSTDIPSAALPIATSNCSTNPSRLSFASRQAPPTRPVCEVTDISSNSISPKNSCTSPTKADWVKREAWDSE